MGALRARWLLAALWLGGLAAIGGIGAPTAFAVLPQKMLAAGLASQLFYRMALVGLGLGGVLLVLERRDATSIARSTPLLLVAGGLLFNVLGEFGVVPRLLEAAASAAPDAMLWHGLASLVYLAQLGCVAFYCWLLPARRD
jgi:hypothetical protein